MTSTIPIDRTSHLSIGKLAVLSVVAAVCILGAGCSRTPAAPAAPPAPAAPAAASIEDTPKSPSAAITLTCPAGQTRAETSGLRGRTIFSCLDERGQRQGAGLVSRADGTHLALTQWRDDVEDGALSLHDSAGKGIVRGVVKAGRLMSYELTDPGATEKERLAPLEERLRDEVARAQSCDTHADCVVAVMGVCPFGCGIVTNKADAPRIKELLRAFPSTCMYRCRAGGEARCKARRCELVYH